MKSYEYNFNNPVSLRFTKPIKVTYFKEIVSKSTSWQNAFIDLLKALYKDYSDKLKSICGIVYCGARVPLIGRKEDLYLFRKPGEFAPEMYVELNRSANDIVGKMKNILDICNVNYENVTITYEPKLAQHIYNPLEKENVLDEDYIKVYQKLFLISKLYDDPAGFSIHKIMSMVDDTDDVFLVKKILDNVSWATKLSEENYSFPKKNNSILIEQHADYKIKVYDKVTDKMFFDYLNKQLKMTEETCRSYVSAIKMAEEYARENYYYTSKIYNSSFAQASRLIYKLLNDSDFIEFDIKQHKCFSAAFTKFLKMGDQEKNMMKMIESKSLNQTKHMKIQLDDFSKEKFETTLMKRYRNGMQFDSIDFENFRETYNALYDEKISFDDEELEERLRCCGVMYKNRLFPSEGIIDNNIKKKLFSYIDNCFSSGKTVLYYKAIYQELFDVFTNCVTLADEKMLKAYIEYSAEQGKYYYFSDYMSIKENVKIDHTEEIEEYFLSIGKPMLIDNVCHALSHIPNEQIKRIITTDSHFLRNAKGEYFCVDIFEISDDELEDIAKIISDFIIENGYAVWTDVWNVVQNKMPNFVENNLYLSGIGIRNAIAQRYIGRFRFEKAIISMPEDSYTMKDVYQLYAKHRSEYTADDIYNFSKKLDTVIYFDALAEVSVRVSYDLFVSKCNIDFDVDSIDEVIESFMSKDYIGICEINSFLAFPFVGYEWNEYLLESFLLSYSKKFTILNNGLSLNNVAGAIVKKEGKIKEFEDICAAVLSDSQIELNKNEALNYLADVKMITRRSYKNLDEAIRKANQIRNRKE